MRAVGPFRAGVEACPPRPSATQLERGGALLGDADDAQRGLHAGERAAGDRAALVEDEPRRDAAVAEHLDGLGRRGAADLLVAAEGQPDVLRRRVSGLEQRLDGLADRRRRSPCRRACRGPRSPAVGVDVAAERRRAARAPRRRPGTTSRCAISTTGRSALAPAQRKSRPWVPTAGQLEPLVQQRELRRQLGQQPVEGVGVDARGVAVGDGRDADERLQGGDHAVGACAVTVVPHRPRWTRFVRRRARRRRARRRPVSVAAVADGDRADRGRGPSGMPNAVPEGRRSCPAGCRRSRRPGPRRRRSAGSAARPSPCRCTSTAPASGPRRGRSSPCRARRSGRGRRPCWTAARSPPAPCACPSSHGVVGSSGLGAAVVRPRTGATSSGVSSTRNAQPWLNPALGARSACASIRSTTAGSTGLGRRSADHAAAAYDSGELHGASSA